MLISMEKFWVLQGPFASRCPPLHHPYSRETHSTFCRVPVNSLYPYRDKILLVEGFPLTKKGATFIAVSYWSHVTITLVPVGTLPLMTYDTYFYSDQLHPDFPKRTRGTLPDFLRKKHTTLANITSGRPIYPIRICLSGSLTKASKSYYVIPTAYHDPRSATCKARWQEWWQVTSYDLWQSRRFPQFLTVALKVMMTLPPLRGIMTN